VHPVNPQQQREDLLKREEDRKAELEKSRLEGLLRDFDALSFYESLEKWEESPIPQPIHHRVQVTTLRQQVVLNQPLPISRKELYDLRSLSKESARLLYLLRSIDQRGMECPYIHQQKKHLLERAMEKCERLCQAAAKFYEGKGLMARVSQLLNLLHLEAAKKDLESFKKKLEAVIMMCRHQEFAQDLMKLRSVAFDASVRAPVTKPAQPKSGKQAPPQQRGGFRMGGQTR
jgi:hypothetical protein